MTGPYSLPEDCSLASPVYLINPVFEFLCDITLKIYHFCSLETEQQCEDMFFISSPLIPSLVNNNIQYKLCVWCVRCVRCVLCAVCSSLLGDLFVSLIISLELFKELLINGDLFIIYEFANE